MQADETVSPQEILINKAGEYAMESGKVNIVVSIKDDLVQFQLKDLHGIKLEGFKPSASAQQRWFLFYTKDKWLWAHSSDIGTSVWIPDNEGIYHKNAVVGNIELQSKMPPEFRENLPQSIKKLLIKEP